MRLLAFLVAATAAAAEAPDYVLVEEHHHVLPHILALVAEGKVQKGATLVHLDSHHDMGLPASWNHDDSSSRNDRTSPSVSHHSVHLEHTHINNFLLALGLLDALDHVIFVEMPWSRQCVDLHNRTKSLRLGFVDGVPRVAYEATVSEQRALRGIFEGHQIVDELETVKTLKFSVIALSDAPRMISKLVGDTDVILDVDLDVYATTSPGALALRSAGLDSATIRRLYRLAHDMCVFDATFDFSRAAVESNCKVEPLGSGPVTVRLFQEDLRDVVDSAEHASDILWTDSRRDAFTSTLRPFSSDLKASFNIEEKMREFIQQPFHDDANSLEGVGRVLRETIRQLDRVKVVTAVRSPFYAPAELLGEVECKAYELFSEVFGTGGTLLYHDGVKANRTGCLQSHPVDSHHSVGAFRHVETMELKEQDVDAHFFSDEESDVVVEACFVNDGDEEVEIYWSVLKLETLQPGKKTYFKTTAGSRWSFRRGDDVLKTVHVGRSARNVYPLHGASFVSRPVEMLFFTPSYARIVFDAGDGEVEYEGDLTQPVETYHGHIWRAYDALGNLLGSRTVDAAEGYQQEFHTEL